MAFSITVDAQFWDDPRLEDLIIILGEQRALGACLLAWYLSRKYWLQDERLIPEIVWKSRKLPKCLIETGFAELRSDGIFVTGVEKFAEKYKKRVADSKAAAERRWTKKPNENNETNMPPASASHATAMPHRCNLDLDLDLNKKEEREEFKIESAPLEACKKTWKETLSHFGQNRNLTISEERLISKAIQENKSAEIVDLALYGARFEPSSPKWNPSENVDVARVLTKDRQGNPRIQKFVGYGSQAKCKRIGPWLDEESE